MPMTNFPNGFRNGVTLRNVPVEIPHPGKVFWVNNSSVLPDGGAAGSDSGKGDYIRPFASVDYAIGKCTANRGDVIYVMPGHVETVGAASAVDFDVAGVRVIGLGHGSKQARFDFTATDGTVVVDADDIGIYNMNFHANVSAVVIGLSVIAAATDLVVQGCTFDVETTATDEFLIAINIGVGCNRFALLDNVMDQGLGGAAHAIKLVGATAGGTIQSNRIVGDYSTANIGGITTLSTEIYILDNDLINGASGNINAQPVIEMLTGTTGMVARNYITSDLATQVAATVGDTMVYFENFRSDEAGAGITGHTSSATIVISADA